MALKGVWRRTTPLDRLLVLLLFAAALGGFAWLGHRPAGARVVALRDGRVIFTAPLDEPRTVELAGPLGNTVLRIADGAARILDSPCPRKICIGMGAISRRGAMVACVPNHILVRIEGKGAAGKEQSYDLLSR